MKKFFSLTMLGLVVNYFVNAQNTQTQSQSRTQAQTSAAQFGVKAGINISNIDRRDAIEYDSKTGFHVGALAHIHLSDQFAVQPEVMYSTQGAESGTVKVKRDYINIPVLLQLMTNNGFRLQTGPQVGFLILAKDKHDEVEVSIKDRYNTVDFAWSFGAGYLSKSGLGVDARYNLGISDVNDVAGEPKATNTVWQFGIFYQFMQ